MSKVSWGNVGPLPYNEDYEAEGYMAFIPMVFHQNSINYFIIYILSWRVTDLPAVVLASSVLGFFRVCVTESLLLRGLSIIMTDFIYIFLIYDLIAGKTPPCGISPSASVTPATTLSTAPGTGHSWDTY